MQTAHRILPRDGARAHLVAFSLAESRDCRTDSPSPASPILGTAVPSVSSLQSRALPRASGCSLSSKNGLFQNLRMGPLCSLPTLVLAGNCRVLQAFQDEREGPAFSLQGEEGRPRVLVPPCPRTPLPGTRHPLELEVGVHWKGGKQLGRGEG